MLEEARAEAEAGIVRCDGRIAEAERPGSPLGPYIGLYIQQRQAFALAAAHHHARIEAMHYDSKYHKATVRQLYVALRTKHITLVQWAAAMRVILGR